MSNAKLQINPRNPLNRARATLDENEKFGADVQERFHIVDRRELNLRSSCSFGAKPAIFLTISNLSDSTNL